MVMKPIGDLVGNAAAGTASAAWRARALQKTSATADLRGGQGQQTHQPPPHAHKQLQTGLPHSGTDDAVSFRNASHPLRPRLTAAFTAQLLGQILPDPERRPSAGRFYGQLAMPLAPGFDTKL